MSVLTFTEADFSVVRIVPVYSFFMMKKNSATEEVGGGKRVVGGT